MHSFTSRLLSLRLPQTITSHSFRNFSAQQQTNIPLFVSASQIPEVSQANKITKTVFLDVRPEEEYNNGHVPSAVHVYDVFTYLLPSSHPDDLDKMNSFFSDKFGEAGISAAPDEYVVVYEAGLSKMYGSSCRGYFFLKHLGHPNVSVLDGGFHKYVEQGHEVCTKPQDAEPVQFKMDPHPHLIASVDDVMDVVNGKRRAHLLDVRDADEWLGTSSSPYGADFCPRKGRLPGAKWIEWYEFMENGHPRSDQSVEKMMAAQGISKDDDIILYCFKGARASNTLMMLNRAGYHRVTNYLGSWNEWSRDSDLPIDDRVFEA